MLNCHSSLFANPPQMKKTPPCILVIFGATGDLTSRKLFPAIYHLQKDRRLPESFACVGFARRAKSHADFRNDIRSALTHAIAQELDVKLWEQLQQVTYYHQSDFDNDQGYRSLREFLQQLDQQLGTQGNRLFYLSTPPQFFSTIIRKLKEHQLFYPPQEQHQNAPWSRVIIEKPFGRDLNSAIALQNCIDENLDESCVYRIDHYLGKETVQNILTTRLTNTIFQSCWNAQYIDHVQITVSESIGINTRGNLFEGSGMLRDMVQNHMMQLLCLLAMEPPSSFSSEAIKKEKLQVLQHIQPINLDNPLAAVRGQYGPGIIGDVSVLGYRQEENVHPESNVETYAAVKLFIDNPRWHNVPFYLRAGKRLHKRKTDIAIFFKQAHQQLLSSIDCATQQDVLVIRIQPDEGIFLRFNCKVPGTNHMIRPVNMDFRYDDYFGTTTPEAYERLIYDCMLGDRTLFTGCDEVLQSWSLFTPLLDFWKEHLPAEPFPNYASGSFGPAIADQLIQQDGRHWQEF